MANENGNGAVKTIEIEGRPSIFVYETLSGIIFHITPLNLATLRAIQLRAADMFPYPDKERYQHPEENAFDPNQLSPAEDNPEYVAAVKAIDFERAQWVDKAIFNYAAKMPKYPTQLALVDAYKSQLNDLKAIAKFEKDDSDYDIILLNLVLTGNTGGIPDYVQIIRLAIQTVALSPAEVQAGIRFFRPNIQRATS